MARIDPHLICGCEVALDVEIRLLQLLYSEVIQLHFLRSTILGIPAGAVGIELLAQRAVVSSSTVVLRSDLVRRRAL
ncbi:hypothetical protein BD626DRAFT_506195, partial [Schizophyllum amplum]